MDDRRTFTLQLHDRIEPELCPECGTDVGGHMQWEGSGAWGCTVGENAITRFTAMCPECKTVTAYQDNDDGRGPLRVAHRIEEPKPGHSVHSVTIDGVSIPNSAITIEPVRQGPLAPSGYPAKSLRKVGKARGSYESTVTFQLDPGVLSAFFDDIAKNPLPPSDDEEDDDEA